MTLTDDKARDIAGELRAAVERVRYLSALLIENDYDIRVTLDTRPIDGCDLMRLEISEIGKTYRLNL